MHKSEIVFLGLCSRAQLNKNSHNWNIIGLSSILYAYILPSKFTKFMAFAVKVDALKEPVSLKILNEDDSQIGSLELRAEFREDKPDISELSTNCKAPWVLAQDQWTIAVPRIDAASNIMLHKPGHYRIVQTKDAGTDVIGGFTVVPVISPPLSPERIKAIESDPNASKFVRLSLGCQQCDSKFLTYFGLERSQKMEDEGWLWTPDLTENNFNCSCGITEIDLTYIKSGIHSLLGRSRSEQTAEIIPYYERSSLLNVRNQFFDLIDSKPREELIQQFISANPILLHMFSAAKIIPKPSIGVRFKSDFAILDARGDLILVELERADIKLLKKNGHRAQDLIHAFDQVDDWLIKFSEHRISILDDLDIRPDEVHNVKGAVIAGREKGYDAAHMRNLKMRKTNDISFMTYDDILSAMDMLVEKIELN